MPNYWLDSDVMIQAHRFHYAFDIAPGFWDGLERAIERNVLCSPQQVYDEILDGGETDELERWARRMKELGFFCDPSENVQTLFGRVSQYVVDNWDPHHSSPFLSGADPWLIAHALDAGTKICAHEVAAGPTSHKVKIPDVCQYFGVECIQVFELLRDLKLQLRL